MTNNLGKGALWKRQATNERTPVYSGQVTAHRNIRAGEELDLALWINQSDNPKAPAYNVKLSDKFVPQQGGRQGREDFNRENPPDDDFGDSEIPF